jgi:predicted RNA-binding Zn-ribbon protein involved in translation (DUF1610 family)
MTAVCESCGAEAFVRLVSDGSTWCYECHAGALRLGYDTDLGEPIVTQDFTDEACPHCGAEWVYHNGGDRRSMQHTSLQCPGLYTRRRRNR